MPWTCHLTRLFNLVVLLPPSNHFVSLLHIEHCISESRRAASVPSAATAAKSLQSCPTLCDHIDGSPLDSPVPGILQARTLEWVAPPSLGFSRPRVLEWVTSAFSIIILMLLKILNSDLVGLE